MIFLISCGKTKQEIRDELNKGYTNYYYNQIHYRDSLISNKDSIINSIYHKPITYYWYSNNDLFGKNATLISTDSSYKINDTIFCKDCQVQIAIITSKPNKLK